ncbi:hypothetical protein LRS74_23355 [Streptomyces sp. LX-29]|uniref:hypothetical protein n=1 Tax=Streptomyces sp. LX-29 TaxID=2900152 RepID=UPI00240DCDA6|nr:hypothetical protein [Streptomyces sp. LX-29]WFB09654.1 hypothetical protein LRS74_23355 [Streptomyces sp. LX-29]
MGALRHARRLLAAGLTGVAVLAVTACEPEERRGLSAIGVAITTDKVATRALERGGIGVRWMTCTADLKGDQVIGASSSPASEASVDCRGETERGDAEIRVTGVVTHAREGRCVRGDLTAKVAGKQVFRANVIGECGGGGEGGGDGGERPPSDGATRTAHQPTDDPATGPSAPRTSAPPTVGK